MSEANEASPATEGSEVERAVRLRCFHGCGRTCSDTFYKHMLKTAKHPPLCVCRYGLSSSAWSLWVSEQPNLTGEALPTTDEETKNG